MLHGVDRLPVPADEQAESSPWTTPYGRLVLVDLDVARRAPAPSTTRSSRSRTARAASIGHQRRRPDRFFFLRGGGGGGARPRRGAAPAARRSVAGRARPAPALGCGLAAARLPAAAVRRRRTRPADASRSRSARCRLSPVARASQSGLLAHGPEVRRDPVDEQAGGERMMNGDEDERQRHEDHALVLVHRRRIRMLDSSCELTYRTMSTTSTPPVALSVRSGMKRNCADAGPTCSQFGSAALVRR